MGGEVNFPSYCINCAHRKYEGMVMVGSDSCGGGPEESYSCRKDRNMVHYWYHSVPCPDYQNENQEVHEFDHS